MDRSAFAGMGGAENSDRAAVNSNVLMCMHDRGHSLQRLPRWTPALLYLNMLGGE